MIKLVILFFSLSTINAFSASYESKIKCKAGNCEKVEIFNGIDGAELKIEDLKVGSCLLDNKRNLFYRLTEVDISAKKIALVSEVEEGPVTVTLKREVIYTDTKDFNVRLRQLPCTMVDGQIINNETYFTKCLNENGPRAFKLFCEKERKKNF